MAKRPFLMMGRSPETSGAEKLFMNGRARPMKTMVAAGVFLSLFVGVFVMIIGHSTASVDTARIAWKSTTLSDTIKPTANAGPDQNVSVGEKVVFDASLSTDAGGRIAYYNWSFNYDGVDEMLHGADANFTFERTGEYNVTLNVTDEAGLFDTDQVLIKVATEKADTSTLVYSGAAAAMVAALLVVLFFALRNRKGVGDKEELSDDSEEEFEETEPIEEGAPEDTKRRPG
jgi:PKD repeat protein